MFLRGSLIATAALAAPVAFARYIEQRSLTFIHTHTGEKLVAPYFCGGTYQSACLHQVNRLLRD